MSAPPARARLASLCLGLSLLSLPLASCDSPKGRDSAPDDSTDSIADDSAPTGDDATGVEDCFNGDDDDHDSQTDTADDDCASTRLPTDADQDADLDGYVGGRSGDDCDDEDPTINPGAAEICDEQDNDCDGKVDETDETAEVDGWQDVEWVAGCTVYYLDADQDGWGDDGRVPTCACTTPDRFVEAGGDCDDSSAAHHPGATPVCDDWWDDDCDGLDDDEEVELSSCSDADEFCEGGGCTQRYLDGDADEHGDGDLPRCFCDAELTGADGVADSYVDDALDCDDADASWTWLWTYADLDEDGYGDETDAGTMACAIGAYSAINNADCDDTTDTISPAVQEDCATSADEDCSGTSNDEGGTGCQYLNLDQDGDGYGLDEVEYCMCDVGAGLTWYGEEVSVVSDDTDCDDTRPDVNPGATEICDAEDLDEDCDEDTLADCDTGDTGDTGS